jgi:CBS domain-containing protein
MKTVKDAMTAKPVTVDRTTSAAEAANLMAKGEFGPLPVVEGSKLIGIVTDRDLVIRVMAKGRDPKETPVGDVCTEDPVAVPADEGLDEAIGLMERHQVRRLPVVKEGRLVGMLSQADLAREQPHERTGQLLEEISR